MWRSIQNFSNYEANDNGDIRYKHSQKLLAPFKHPNGYLTVPMVSDTGSQTRQLVHRIIAEVFIPNDEHLLYVNHKDENKENNSVTNLEWCTAKYNANYGNRNSKISYSKCNPVVKIHNNIKTIYGGFRLAAKIENIGQSSISNVVNHRRKSLYGATWRYATPEEIKVLGTRDFIILNILQ